MLSDRQTWPSLIFEVQALPWHWRIKPYVYWDKDDYGLTSQFSWLFFIVRWGYNTPPFSERDDSIDVAPGVTYGPFPEKLSDINLYAKEEGVWHWDGGRAWSTEYGCYRRTPWTPTLLTGQLDLPPIRPAGFTEPGPSADGGISYGGAG